MFNAGRNRAAQRVAGVIVAAVVVAAASRATAAPIVYFGEDRGVGEGTVLVATPNAAAAQANFLAGLIAPGVETFEGIAAGSNTPLGINFANGITATLTGVGTVISLPDGVTNGLGRYGVTGDPDRDERYWQVAGRGFSVEFSNPVSAFGFFGIDIGDANGQITVTTAGGLEQRFNVGNLVNGPGGGVLFWGIIDPTATFSKVTFGNTAAGSDIFAFDNFTVGTLDQLAVPEPTTLALIALGLAGIARRRLAE